MIQREMVIPKKEQNQSNDNDYSWLQTIFFEPGALQGEGM